MSQAGRPSRAPPGALLITMDHQEFPKMLYRKGSASDTITVNSAEEQAALPKRTWFEAPTPSEDGASATSAADDKQG